MKNVPYYTWQPLVISKHPLYISFWSGFPADAELLIIHHVTVTPLYTRFRRRQRPPNAMHWIARANQICFCIRVDTWLTSVYMYKKRSVRAWSTLGLWVRCNWIIYLLVENCFSRNPAYIIAQQKVCANHPMQKVFILSTLAFPPPPPSYRCIVCRMLWKFVRVIPPSVLGHSAATAAC